MVTTWFVVCSARVSRSWCSDVDNPKSHISCDVVFVCVWTTYFVTLDIWWLVSDPVVAIVVRICPLWPFLVPFWLVLDPLLYVRVNSPIRTLLNPLKYDVSPLKQLNSAIKAAKMAQFRLLNQLNSVPQNPGFGLV